MLNERVSTRVSSREIDEGLRNYMLKVYNYMTGGLIVTALTVYLLVATGAIASLFSFSPEGVSLSFLGWIVTVSPIIVVLYFGHAVRSASLSKVKTVFWLFSALMGASIAPIVLAYTGTSVTRVFLISAATFGSMSIYGYTTKRNLTGVGSFLLMGLIGIIIASIVNIFWASSALYFTTSIIGVAIFVGLTAYDTQKIRRMYAEGDEDYVERSAVSGALDLYMDFINLFIYLLRLIGDRR